MSHVPFKFDVNDGFVSCQGAVFLDGEFLVIETTRKLLDMISFRSETFQIPVDEIETVELEAGMVKSRFVVRPFDREWIRDFPGEPVEELALPIARKHREAAEALARETRLRNLPR